MDINKVLVLLKICQVAPSVRWTFIYKTAVCPIKNISGTSHVQKSAGITEDFDKVDLPCS